MKHPEPPKDVPFEELDPYERVIRMNRIFLEMIRFRAEQEGRSEYDVYREYIQDDPDPDRGD